MVTPPNRWSSQAYISHVSVSQKLDRVLCMFEEMKRRESWVERDSIDTKEQLSLLQEDLAEQEKHRLQASKVRKKIPCDVSVRFLNNCVLLWLTICLVARSS